MPVFKTLAAHGLGMPFMKLQSHCSRGSGLARSKLYPTNCASDIENLLII